jgi:crotonobetainyl-CoA:carnitine CoA-transferase CaiB-like acyl-CoA transferase
VPLTIADRMVGLHAAHSVAMALYGRERTGRGCRIDVPMFETMASVVLSDHIYGHTFEPPSGGAGYVRLLSPGRRPYETSDGYICALVYNDGHWQRFLHAIERDDLRVDPRFADLASRTRHIDEVYGFLGQTLCVQSTAHWLELFEDIDVPAVPLNTVESLLDDPHLAAVGFFRQVEHPSEGAMRTFGAPARWVGYDVSKLAPAPRLGEHTESVLRECGFDAVALASLLVGGAAVPVLADAEVSE